MLSLLDFQTRDLECFDDAFQTAFQMLAASGGTLCVPDGECRVSRPLLVPPGVSLVLEPNAVIRAADDFEGEAVVVIGQDDDTPHRAGQSLRGGAIDGNGLDVTGVLIEYASRFDIAQLEVRNARRKGIHVGKSGHYEVNIRDVRIALGSETRSVPGSIGLHYDKCTDSLVNAVVVIGYETGVRSDSSSNDFSQLHVWSVPENGPLKYCFYCNGWNDSWNQCYADSPLGVNEGFGFYVSRPFNRIVAGRVYCNDFATDGATTGIFVAPGGERGTYVANHFTAREGHHIKAAFAGNLGDAQIWGNSYAPTVMGGKPE